jgi:hypothetical protein
MAESDIQRWARELQERRDAQEREDRGELPARLPRGAVGGAVGGFIGAAPRLPGNLGRLRDRDIERAYKLARKRMPPSLRKEMERKYGR